MAEEMEKNEELNEEATEEQNVEETAIENSETEEAVTAPVQEAKKTVIKNTMEEIEKSLLAETGKLDVKPHFSIGDTVRVYVKISEGGKERLQPYEGVVIAIKHGGPRLTFTVRRISYEVAVERVFPFYSPYVEKIDVVRRGRVRRAKLYYLRGRFGKAAKIREKVNIKKKDKSKA